jgi:hypothetical protein
VGLRDVPGDRDQERHRGETGWPDWLLLSSLPFLIGVCRRIPEWGCGMCREIVIKGCGEPSQAGSAARSSSVPFLIGVCRRILERGCGMCREIVI